LKIRTLEAGQRGAVASENAGAACAPQHGKQTPVCKNFVRYAGLLSSPYEKTILERKALDNCLGLPRSLSLPDFLERRFEAA
jgi:hypothetical protein